MFKLFESIGKETILKEYKEFSFKLDIDRYYDIQEINSIVKTGVLDHRFNKLVIDNIKHYVKYYIPRYVSAFCNCDSIFTQEIKDNPTLYFGVDDYGEITGIPYLGIMDTLDIVNYIKNHIKSHIITTDKTKDYIIKNLCISIEKLDVNESLIYSDLDKTIEKIEDDYRVYKIEYDRYMEEYTSWYKMLNKYSTKLITICTNKETYEELKNYILSIEPEKIYVMSQDISEMLEHVELYKNNPENYIYWICKFRDYKIDSLIRIKPIKPFMRMKYINYSSEFVKLERLRKKFLETNKDINYYIIKVTIPTQCEDEVFYKDIFNSIKKKTRTLDENGEPISK